MEEIKVSSNKMMCSSFDAIIRVATNNYYPYLFIFFS